MADYTIKISATNYAAAVSFESFYDLYYKKELNKISELKVTLYDLTGAQKSLVIEGSILYLFYDSTLVQKAEIRSVDRDEANDEYILDCNGMEVKLHDQSVRGRTQWDDMEGDTIVKALISGIMAEGTIEAALKVGFRAEEDSVLRSIMSLARDIGWDWYVDQAEGYDTGRLNFVAHKGSLSVTESFDATSDALDISRNRNVDNVFNVIRVLGYGDGINQLISESFAASTNEATLAAEITATDTSLTVNEIIDSFPDTGDLRAGREWIKYTSKNNETKTFSGLTRGHIPGTNPPADNPYYIAAYAHKKGAEILDLQYTSGGFPSKEDAQSGSSIAVYGLRENIYPEPSIMHQSTVDLLGQRLKLKYKTPIDRAELIVTKELLTAEIGDLVRIVFLDMLYPAKTLFPSVGLFPGRVSATYRLIAYEFNDEDWTIRLTLGTIADDFLRDLSALQKTIDITSIYGLGSTVAFCLPSFAQNVENSATNDFYAYMDFEIPEHCTAINICKLRWQINNFRAPLKVTAGGSAHTHSFTGKATASESAHTHGFLGKTTSVDNGSYESLTTISELSARYCAVKDHKHKLTLNSGTPDYPVGIKGGESPADLFVAEGYGTNVQTNIEDEAHVTAHYVETTVKGPFLKGTHTHSLNAVVTDAGSSHTHSLSGVVSQSESAHTHQIGYGTQEEGSPADSIAVEIKIDAGEWTALSGSPYTGDQSAVDVRDLIGAAPGGKLVQLRFLPEVIGRAWMRGGGTFQGFVESK